MTTCAFFKISRVTLYLDHNSTILAWCIFRGFTEHDNNVKWWLMSFGWCYVVLVAKMKTQREDECIVWWIILQISWRREGGHCFEWRCEVRFFRTGLPLCLNYSESNWSVDIAFYRKQHRLFGYGTNEESLHWTCLRWKKKQAQIRSDELLRNSPPASSS